MWFVVRFDAEVRALAVAKVAALEPKPRERKWSSLTACVIDAVWSINADYDTVVAPGTRALIETLAPGVDPLVESGDFSSPDPAPLTLLLARCPDERSLADQMNWQVTSKGTKKRKADAALQYARILVEYGIDTRHHAHAVLLDDERFAQVDSALRRVHGEGASGVRRNYMWMLVGDDDGVKPDRMLLRWFAKEVGVTGTPEQVRDWVRLIAADITATSGHSVTPWSIDHAIWSMIRKR